jgi:alkanesulfonate monooxygenase SsuD/methylene tetrahydromethanopterin reductase-like flavin-dependent oxidoreductase (luciferase family)
MVDGLTGTSASYDSMGRMTTTPRLGVCYTPFMPTEALPVLASGAEAAGLDDLWVWEDTFKQSGVASAAAALAWTERISVRIGLLPVPLRNVGLTAMEVATLDRLFPGRFVVGIGHGVQEWMGQAGVRVASPVTLLREYAEALRRLLAGERVTVEGRYVRLTDVALDWPPLAPPAVLIGGAGPRTLALAAELGDGVMLGGNLDDDGVEAVCRLVAGATGSRPRPAPHHGVTTTVVAATGHDAGARMEREVRAWGGEPGNGNGIAGDPGEIAQAVAELGRRGASTVVVQPTRDEPDLPALLAALGQVRSILRA